MLKKYKSIFRIINVLGLLMCAAVLCMNCAAGKLRKENAWLSTQNRTLQNQNSWLNKQNKKKEEDNKRLIETQKLWQYEKQDLLQKQASMEVRSKELERIISSVIGGVPQPQDRVISITVNPDTFAHKAKIYINNEMMKEYHGAGQKLILTEKKLESIMSDKLRFEIVLQKEEAKRRFYDTVREVPLRGVKDGTVREVSIVLNRKLSPEAESVLKLLADLINALYVYSEKEDVLIFEKITSNFGVLYYIPDVVDEINTLENEELKKAARIFRDSLNLPGVDKTTLTVNASLDILFKMIPILIDIRDLNQAGQLGAAEIKVKKHNIVNNCGTIIMDIIKLVKSYKTGNFARSSSYKILQ